MKDEQPQKTQATKLVEMADEVELFHDGDYVGYAIIKNGKHKETYRIRTKPFKHWLTGQYFEKFSSTPGSQAIQDAIGAIEGQALFNGPKRDVNLRIAGNEERLVIDLGTQHWDRVLVTRNGWQLCTDCNEMFVRSRGMQALPFPRKCSDGLLIIRRFLNVSEDEVPLLIGWLIGSLRPLGPYPILAIHGEQGSAKSTTSKVCRRLIDPNKADLRSAPRDERDLVIAASNSWVIALENLSSISNSLSDSLCRISTGSGFATRELYSDNDEVIFNVQRPLLINGIEELATRSDLIDRAIFLSLPRIVEKQRKTEKEFWSEFHEVKGFIFGWLLDCVVTAFRNLPSTDLDSLPRMADFAKWVCASETSTGWEGHQFLEAYLGNRSNANATAVEASAIGQAIVDYLNTNHLFEGSHSDLLEILEAQTTDQVRKQRQMKGSGWPRTARGLSGQLRRIAPNLRQLGFEVEFDLPDRHLRLELQATVATVATAVDANHCDDLPDCSVGTNCQTPTQSGDVICDCGAEMIASGFVINGWQNWDCPNCQAVVPVPVGRS